MADEDELPTVDEIECEFEDLYRHDEEQAYLTLMSQDIKSINFPCEENYTVKLCKELVAYHNPDTHPIGSFELIASNRVRSDEETLGEIFNGQPYYTDKEPAEDPDFDWTPRKEQVFSDKMLMQLSVWKKDWDEDKNAYEPVDLGYKPYGYHQTKIWKKAGYLTEEGKLKPEQQLIEEGRITDPEIVENFQKKQAVKKVLREEYCVREKHADEVIEEIKDKGDLAEAIEWLRLHKEKDWNDADALKKKKDAGEKYEVIEEDEPWEEEEPYYPQ